MGAHVVEVAQVPGALLFHGSHSLSVKTAQPCRQLCSGGCGGERRGEERRRRGEIGADLLFFSLILLSISGLIFLLYNHSSPDFWPQPCLFYLSAEVPQRKQRPRLAFNSLDNIYMSVCSVCVCFCCCHSSQTM